MIPNHHGKIKVMFQTTNQVYDIDIGIGSYASVLRRLSNHGRSEFAAADDDLLILGKGRDRPW